MGTNRFEVFLRGLSFPCNNSALEIKLFQKIGTPSPMALLGVGDSPTLGKFGGNFGRGKEELKGREREKEEEREKRGTEDWKMERKRREGKL